ncbi:hypothetical protein M8J77_008555 [Diaphorina citri]|nr:hypothetical protein M8J77_008555 [Diaphorina citri]
MKSMFVFNLQWCVICTRICTYTLPYRNKPFIESIVEELHQSSSDLSRSKRSYSVRENEPTTEEDDLSTVVTDSEIVKSTVNTARDTASSTETVLSLEDADNNLFGDRSARDDSDQKLMLIMRLPSNAMFLAKHYDLKGLAR